jgi:2-hydroxy-6-oxonona-2,4-dienedioate hydrolase
MVSTSALTAESTSRFVTVDGKKVHFNEAGTGDETLVMIHGGGPGASGWSNFNRNIGPLAEKYRVLLLDQPGYGQTEYHGNKESLPDMCARMLKGLLDELGIEKITPVGNSMGGAASVHFTLAYPERVDKLILMGAAGSGQPLFTGQPSAGIMVLREAAQNPTEETLRRLMHFMVYDDSFLTDELLQERLAAALANKRSDPPPPMMRPVWQEFGKIEKPTLIIWGADDHMEPLDAALRFLRGIKGSRLHVFAQCGHWAQFECPDEFNRLVDDFVKNN